jgi:methyl-accepting chemotaxis protein
MQGYSRTKLSHQFMISLAAMLLLTLGQGSIAYRQMAEIDEHVRIVDGLWMPASRQVAEMKAEFFNFRLSEFQLATSDDPRELQSAEQRRRDRLSVYRGRESQAAGLLNHTDAAGLLNRLHAQIEDYLRTSLRILELSRAGDRAGAMALLTGPSRESRNMIAASFETLADAIAVKGSAAREASDRAFLKARIAVVLACALAILWAFVVSWRLMRSVTVASAQLRQAGTHTATGSTGLITMVRQQEATVSEQSAASAQITASIQEIAATARQLQIDMNQMAEATEDTCQQALAGRDHLRELGHVMRQVIDGGEVIAAKLALLNDKAASINGIVTTINKVADRTNLLSLNAAIQAQKAGEAGLGFSVVAGEIRRLANQTADATQDIELILQDIQSAVSVSVTGVDQFSADLRRNVEAVREVSEHLSRVIAQIQTIGPLFESFRHIMESQSLGSDQITQAMLQLNAGMRQSLQATRDAQQAIALLDEAVREVQAVGDRL